MDLREQLAIGTWVTRERVALAGAAVLGVTILCFGWLLWTAHGTVDALGRPIGTDFSDVYAAGWMADHGRAAAAWNWPAHYAVQQAIHRDRAIPFYGWHYPPPFLLVAALLARLPYLSALAVWQGATALLALTVARAIVPDRLTALAAIGFPAVFVCLGHGQNGFLTAALLGGGLLLLDRRPLVAGLLLGCLVYKPQFAPVLPLLLIAGGRWRAITGAAASTGTLLALTTAIWGWGVWDAFLGSLPLTRHVVIEGMNTGAWKIVSPFAAVRLNGGGVGTAYMVQAAASAVALASVALAARASAEVRAAVTITAAFLATPYVFDYDMVAIGIAIAFLAARARGTGWRRWERTILALAWAAPLCGRQVAEWTGVPLDLFAIIAVWTLAVGRAVEEQPAISKLLRPPRLTPSEAQALRPSPSRRSRAASGP